MTAELIQAFLENIFAQVALILLFTLLAQLVVRIILHKIIARIMSSHKYETKLEKRKRTETLISIFDTAMAVVLWIGATVAILNLLEVNIAALATGAGVVGVLIGFGAQNTIKDLLAGIFVIAENQYRVGDIVTLHSGGVPISGVVEEITIRITRLRDLDGNVHIVRNGETGVVTNLSFKFAQVNIDLNVGYDTDIDTVKKVINEVGEAQAKDEVWADSIIAPIQFLRLNDFAASSMVIKCVGKVQPAKQWDIAGDFRIRIKKAFDKNDIDIPFQQVVIHTNEGK
jgi:moderate conductance mechanosensitive channel